MPQLDKKELKVAQKKADKLGVTVEYSTRKNKKLDVFKDGKKIHSIGDKRYTDFIQTGDKKQRELYKKRHEKDRKVKGSGGFYADKILW